MKRIISLAIFLILCSFGLKAQHKTDTSYVAFQNDKMKVTAFVSSPGKDVCGKGKHSHKAHLTIMLTDANVKITPEGGKTQNVTLKAGTMFWSEGSTHTAVNSGNNVARIYLVELK